MEEISVAVRVPAKVNLVLHVGDTDESGYHQLGTVFQAVSIYDELVAELAPAGEFSVEITGEGAGELPTDNSNLAIRAARMLAVACQVKDAGVRLRIHKRIPVAGGMAGGSADAAASLLACSVLWDVAAEPEVLVDQAKLLGADVPFALMGGVAIGTDRGDDLVPVLTRGTMHWVFATSFDGMSTPAVFRRFDEMGPGRSTEISTELLAALATGDARTVGRLLANDLHDASIDLDPRLAGVIEAGMAKGALGSVISGSGPTIAFLVATPEDGLRLANSLAAHPDVKATHRAHGPVPGAQLRA